MGEYSIIVGIKGAQLYYRDGTRVKGDTWCADGCICINHGINFKLLSNGIVR